MEKFEIQNEEKKEGKEIVKFYEMDVTTVSTLCAFFGEKRLIGAEVIGKVSNAKIRSLRKAAKKGTFRVDEEKYNIFHIWKEMRYSLCSLESYTGRTSHSIAYNDSYILDVAFNGKKYSVTLYNYSPERLKAIAKFYCFDNFACEEKTDENFVCEMEPSEFDAFLEGKDVSTLAVKANVKAEVLNHARDPIFDALKEKIVGTFGLDDYVEEKGYMIKSIKTPNNIYFVKDGEGKILICGGDSDFAAEQIVRA